MRDKMHTAVRCPAMQGGKASNLKRVATFLFISLALSSSTTETPLQHALFRVPIHSSALVFFCDSVTNTSYLRGVFNSMRTRFAESNLKFFELNQDDMDDLDVCLLPEYLFPNTFPPIACSCRIVLCR
jgi:hypothetical protein